MQIHLIQDGAGAAKRTTVTFVVFILLLMGLTPTGNAQIYSCVTNDGKRFFTDDPTLFPPDCRMMTTNEKAGDGGLSIVGSPYSPPASVRGLLIKINEKREQQNQQLEEWKKTAVELVSEYKAAQMRLCRATRARTRSQIRQEIHDIKARRDALRVNVAAA
jgi:hypothetical protein